MFDGWVNIPTIPTYQFNIFTNTVRSVRNHKKRKRDILPDGTAVYTFRLPSGELVKYKPYELKEMVLKGGEYCG